MEKHGVRGNSQSVFNCTANEQSDREPIAAKTPQSGSFSARTHKSSHRFNRQAPQSAQSVGMVRGGRGADAEHAIGYLGWTCSLA
jgi:hypothetical protein